MLSTIKSAIVTFCPPRHLREGEERRGRGEGPLSAFDRQRRKTCARSAAHFDKKQDRAALKLSTEFVLKTEMLKINGFD